MCSFDAVVVWMFRVVSTRVEVPSQCDGVGRRKNGRTAGKGECCNSGNDVGSEKDNGVCAVWSQVNEELCPSLLQELSGVREACVSDL